MNIAFSSARQVLLALAVTGNVLAATPTTASGLNAAPVPPEKIALCEQLQRAAQEMLRTSPSEAERLCRQAMELAVTFSPPDTNLSRTQMQMGEILRWQKKMDLAEQSFKNAVQSCEKAVGPNHPELIAPLEGLANFYSWPTLKPDDVVPLYRRILTIVQQAPKRDDREIARRARNLADVEMQRGRPEEADRLYQTALAAVEKYDDELPSYLLNAADFYRAWGKYDRAEPLARRVLAIREKQAAAAANQIDAQLDVSTALTCLADVYQAAGTPARAEPLYARGASIVEKINGGDSPDVAPALTRLAVAVSAQGKHDAAAPIYQRALALTEKGSGQDALEVADILEKYAVTLKAMNQSDQAKIQADRAAVIRARAQGAPTVPR